MEKHHERVDGSPMAVRCGEDVLFTTTVHECCEQAMRLRHLQEWLEEEGKANASIGIRRVLRFVESGLDRKGVMTPPRPEPFPEGDDALANTLDALVGDFNAHAPAGGITGAVQYRQQAADFVAEDIRRHVSATMENED